MLNNSKTVQNDYPEQRIGNRIRLADSTVRDDVQAHQKVISTLFGSPYDGVCFSS